MLKDIGKALRDHAEGAIKDAKLKARGSSGDATQASQSRADPGRYCASIPSACL